MSDRPSYENHFQTRRAFGPFRRSSFTSKRLPPQVRHELALVLLDEGYIEVRRGGRRAVAYNRRRGLPPVRGIDNCRCPEEEAGAWVVRLYPVGSYCFKHLLVSSRWAAIDWLLKGLGFTLVDRPKRLALRRKGARVKTARRTA